MTSDLITGGHTHSIDIDWSNTLFWAPVSNVQSYECEKNNTKVIQYLLPGFNENNLKVEKKWVNKTEKLSVAVTGKYKDADTSYKEEINISIPVDTKVYNNMSYTIKDGLLTVVLYEIIHNEPEFGIEKER